MQSKYLKRAVRLANSLGHSKIYTEADFYAFVPYSDGCSGYLSKLYNKFGRTISCEACCHMHDWLYLLGGGSLARLKADLHLARCAASAGGDEDGVKGELRRAWRWFRAWFVIFQTVRRFGLPFFEYSKTSWVRKLMFWKK